MFNRRHFLKTAGAVAAAQPTAEWVLGKITSGSNATVTAVYNISIPTASSGVLNFNPVANQTAFPARQYRAVNINATASATTLILVNYGNWNEVLVISTNSTLPDSYYRAIWSTFNTNLGATQFTGTVSSVKQGSAASCQYPPGVSPPYRSDFDIAKCVCAALERAPRVACVCVVCICARVCVNSVEGVTRAVFAGDSTCCTTSIEWTFPSLRSSPTQRAVL